jgi:hypothetical protein
MSDSGLSDGEGVERDWRDQIYYWRGRVKFVGDKKILWSGSWLGSFDGPPDEDKFLESKQTFTVHCTKAKGRFGSEIDGPALAGRYKGIYYMDNDGSGKMDKYKTNTQMKFKEKEGTEETPAVLFNVVGKGMNEFGDYIINGTYDTCSQFLCAPRTYISETDPRVKLSLDELLDHFTPSKQAHSTNTKDTKSNGTTDASHSKKRKLAS